MVYMGYKFRAPRLRAVRQWTEIERAVSEGRVYGVRTIRKQKPAPSVPTSLRVGLGVYGKRRRSIPEA